MVRRAFQKVQKKQKRKYRGLLGVLLVAIAGLGGYAYYQHERIRQQTATAKEIFYSMKSLEVDLANVEKLVRDSQNQQGADQVKKYRARQKEMERNYDRFLTSLRVYDPKMSEDQRLILRTARIFGECELDIPPGFVQEVQNYIKKWQSSPRLAKAVQLAQKTATRKRSPTICFEQNLPPQFFYLALQESDFDPFISGPPTYKGSRKGCGSLFPRQLRNTALRVGPLAEFRRPDVMDDRHHWEKATAAAVTIS